MKLLLHLLAADARRFRLLIAVWIATVIAGGVAILADPAVASHPASARTLSLAAGLLWQAHLLLFVALVPAVVQTHTLVGSDAFWMTRPIPPNSLLLSKLVLLTVLLVLVPAACDAALMAVHAVPVQDIALVSIQTAVLRLVIVVVLMMGASITQNLARFAVLCGGVILGMAVFSAVMLSIAMSWTADESSGATAYLTVGTMPWPVVRLTDQTAVLAGVLLFLCAGLIVLAVQYQGRSRRRSVPLAGAAVLLASLVTAAWPWRLIQRPLRAPGWAESSSAIRLGADPSTVSVESQGTFSGRPQMWRDVRATAWFTDVPGEWHATASLAGATLDLANGVRLTSPGHGYPAALPVEKKHAEPPIHRVLRHVLDVDRMIGYPYPPSGETAIVFLLRQADKQSTGSTAGTYRGLFRIDLTNVAIAGRLPLARGATFQEGAYRVTIEDIEQSDAGITIRTRASSVTTVFDRHPRPVYLAYLRNPALREAASGAATQFQPDVFTSQSFGGMGVYGIYRAGPGFSIDADLVSFPETYGYPIDRMGLSAAWFSGAEVVIVRLTAGGAVTRTLEMTGMSMADNPKTYQDARDRDK